MKIAVCDDNRQILCQIFSDLAAYQEERQKTIFCRGFSNAIDLLDAMKNESFDIVLLDILMPGLTGMQAAHEIREKNKEIRIVFLTSSPEYAIEGYRVQASDYLLKPVTRENLFSVIDELLPAVQKKVETLTIHSAGTVVRLPLDQLEYIEVISKNLYFHMSDRSIRKIYGSLNEYEPLLLAHSSFFKVHRSYLVNLSFVAELNHQELRTASGQTIPIARASWQQVRTAYTDFLFKEAGFDNQKSVAK